MGKKSGPNPCDRGKGGVKRSPLTEASGIVVGLCVEGANRNDMKLTEQTLESMPPMVAAKRDEFLFGPLPVPYDEAFWEQEVERELLRLSEPEWEADLEQERPQAGLCLDKGYDYHEVRETLAQWGYTAHIAARGQEKQAKIAGQKARRWVVERTHSWLNRYRRLLIRWDKKASCYLALLHFACALMTWNQSLFG